MGNIARKLKNRKGTATVKEATIEESRTSGMPADTKLCINTETDTKLCEDIKKNSEYLQPIYENSEKAQNAPTKTAAQELNTSNDPYSAAYKDHRECSKDTGTLD